MSRKYVATREQTVKYFSNNRHYGYRLGQFCENCMILVGANHTFKETVMYGTWFVCEPCKYDLESEIRTGRRSWVYSLNDLENE